MWGKVRPSQTIGFQAFINTNHYLQYRKTSKTKEVEGHRVGAAGRHRRGACSFFVAALLSSFCIARFRFLDGYWTHFRFESVEPCRPHLRLREATKRPPGSGVATRAGLWVSQDVLDFDFGYIYSRFLPSSTAQTGILFATPNSDVTRGAQPGPRRKGLLFPSPFLSSTANLAICPTPTPLPVTYLSRPTTSSSDSPLPDLSPSGI